MGRGDQSQAAREAARQRRGVSDVPSGHLHNAGAYRAVDGAGRRRQGRREGPPHAERNHASALVALHQNPLKVAVQNFVLTQILCSATPTYGRQVPSCGYARVCLARRDAPAGRARADCERAAPCDGSEGAGDALVLPGNPERALRYEFICKTGGKPEFRYCQGEWTKNVESVSAKVALCVRCGRHMRGRLPRSARAGGDRRPAVCGGSAARLLPHAGVPVCRACARPRGVAFLRASSACGVPARRRGRAGCLFPYAHTLGLRCRRGRVRAAAWSAADSIAVRVRWCQLVQKDGTRKNVVAKVSKDPNEDKNTYYRDVQAQACAKQWAMQYNDCGVPKIGGCCVPLWLALPRHFCPRPASAEPPARCARCARTCATALPATDPLPGVAWRARRRRVAGAAGRSRAQMPARVCTGLFVTVQGCVCVVRCCVGRRRGLSGKP